jgi:hypothetical protein
MLAKPTHAPDHPRRSDGVMSPWPKAHLSTEDTADKEGPRSPLKSDQARLRLKQDPDEATLTPARFRDYADRR